MLNRRTLIASGLAAFAAPALAAPILSQGDQPTPAETMPLWPGRAPGAPATMPRLRREPHGSATRTDDWLFGIATPTLEVYRPAQPNGIALMSVPGGGYGFLAITNEGSNVAKRFCPLGYTVFVLTYRLPNEGWSPRADVPLQDAQRAMRLIRANAKRFGCDPARSGVLGFSAGGHLAGSLATMYDDRVYAPVDAADRQSARPDFAGLIYPVATLEQPWTHGGTRDNLLGPSPSDALVEKRSPVKRVTAQTPPSFVVHAIDDGLVPVECSLQWLAATRAAGRPVEAHLPEHGGHGFGIGPAPSEPASLWTELFDKWLGREMRVG